MSADVPLAKNRMRSAKRDTGNAILTDKRAQKCFQEGPAGYRGMSGHT